MREIVFDTETTGFDPLTGDRLVEIGAVELINHVPTGRTYHQYINPDRDVPEEVVKVHGLTNEFLKDYPLFEKVAQEWVDFIGDDGILVAHNATFDMKFINYELKRLGFEEYQWDRVVDTLEIAKSKFPGQRNNLDVLCKRFGIDNSARTFHGALLDAQLLAEVYLELLGGAEPTMDLSSSVKTKDDKSSESIEVKRVFREARKFLFSEEENLAHREFLEKNIKNPIWLLDEVEENKEAN
ncbi:MAG: DNA polymerase III subunit epsilon [Alphaproteobacteria bacterium]|nr:DNA polymerase III subunit epsilon [Alphaproteobacteria bacterium]